jgi:predicted nucleotidyltransferase
MDAELQRYVRRLARKMEELLGKDLVGLYLHGSAAMGAFVPSRSDVDVLAVTRVSISSEAKRAIADALSEAALPSPGVGLELSIVTVDSVRIESDVPSFELHLDIHHTHEDRVVDGVGHDGDPDLLTHYAMARERGIAVLGPLATEAFAPVDRTRLLRAIAADLGWGIEEGLGSYAVLNACRALRFSREGVLCSKPDGGEWALEEGVGDPELIQAALRRQGGENERVDLAKATTFAERVRDELLEKQPSKELSAAVLQSPTNSGLPQYGPLALAPGYLLPSALRLRRSSYREVSARCRETRPSPYPGSPRQHAPQGVSGANRAGSHSRRRRGISRPNRALPRTTASSKGDAEWTRCSWSAGSCTASCSW